MKTKPLFPTLRESNRYIVFKVMPKKHSGKAIESVLQRSFEKYLGIFEMSKMGIKIMDIDDNKGIIKCNHDAQNKVVSAMTMITDIEKENAIFVTEHISGILKKAKVHLKT